VIRDVEIVSIERQSRGLGAEPPATVRRILRLFFQNNAFWSIF